MPIWKATPAIAKFPDENCRPLSPATRSTTTPALLLTSRYRSSKSTRGRSYSDWAVYARVALKDLAFSSSSHASTLIARWTQSIDLMCTYADFSPILLPSLANYILTLRFPRTSVGQPDSGWWCQIEPRASEDASSIPYLKLELQTVDMRSYVLGIKCMHIFFSTSPLSNTTHDRHVLCRYVVLCLISIIRYAILKNGQSSIDVLTIGCFKTC